jgi:hypothetical protein
MMLKWSLNFPFQIQDSLYWTVQIRKLASFG